MYLALRHVHCFSVAITGYLTLPSTALLTEWSLLLLLRSLRSYLLRPDLLFHACFFSRLLLQRHPPTRTYIEFNSPPMLFAIPA
jgi:hypothetical protein